MALFHSRTRRHMIKSFNYAVIKYMLYSLKTPMELAFFF